MTARPIRRNAQTPDRNGKIFYTSTTSLSHISKIARLDKEYADLLNQITSDMENAETLESQLEKIIIKKHALQSELLQYEKSNSKKTNTKSRLDEIFQIIEGLKNHPMEFNDVIIRQIIDCVIVESKEKIKVVFVGGYEVEQEL